ncbi:MAG TPA: endonuclease [Paludibacteraceae bacterium]|nr:endonuclease [Paludibacteraceae bacterium]
MKKMILGLIVLVVSVTLFAAPPASYYTNANGKTSDALRVALQDIIKGHTVVSYDNLYKLYVASDSHPDGSMWDMYSTCTWTHGEKKCGSYQNVCDCYNREHSVPQSWFSSKSPMVSDAFHVYPTDGKVNGQRSNYQFGECSGGKTLTAEALGRLGTSTFSGYSGTVFEPADEYKGDFARTYFYMATRYANQCESWGNHFSTANNGLTAYSVDLFLKWHRQDPVSEKERVRNDAIYGINNTTGYKQGNRNPFIDYPCLAEYIWGNKKGTNVDFTQILSTYSADYATTTDLSGCSCAASVPALIAPTNGSSLVVGAAGKNETVTAQLTVKGVLLTKSLSLAVSGTNASLFTVLPTTVTSTNALAGTTVTVSYKPTALGNHTATLTISSTELAQSTTVTLTGSCSASLVSPTTSGLVFSSDNVMVKNDQTVLVKGTNLSSTVGLSITGTNAALFKVSSASVIATDANAGKNVTVSYTPTTVGTHTATLVVTSSDFTTVNVPLTGTCTFQALDATNVTKNSFNANWTNAGVTNYVLDVSTQTMTGQESAEFLNESFSASQGNFTITNKILPAEISYVWKWASAAYGIKATAYANSTNYAAESWLISPDIDLQNATTAKLTFDQARKFGALEHLSVKVSYDNTNWSDLTVANWPDGSSWSFISSGDVSLDAYIGKIVKIAFVYTSTSSAAATWEIKNVIVSGQKTALANTSITGYPKSVGNVQSYLVVGLQPNTQYYYTVTPTGVPVSEQIAVMTLEENTPNSMQYTDANALVYYTTSDAIHILNLQPGSAVNVFDATGRLCAQRLQSATEEAFVLPEGVYVFKVSVDGVVKSVKVVR